MHALTVAKDQFVYALAESTGALLITNDNDFDRTDRLGIPRLDLYETAAGLRSPGGIQLALADRNGLPQLLVS